MSSKTNEKITQCLLSVIFSVAYLFLSFALIAHAFHTNLHDLLLA
ncbi:MAG: hypothetical protein QOD33_1578 [Pyrinomonadaceae bacterium]|jgi:hypothetical protein|nr:hypothetical protein [Pyrinomonadaceae bacterium]